MLNNKRGSSLIIVICLMAVFTALALAILMSASTLIDSENSQQNVRQTQILSASLSEIISNELSEKKTVYSDDESEINSTGLTKLLYEQMSPYVYYVSGGGNKQFISPASYWFYYDEDSSDPRHRNEDFTQLCFTSDEGEFENAEITLFWLAVDGDEELGNFALAGNEELSQVGKIRLTVEVKAVYKGEQYVVTSEYYLIRTQKRNGNQLKKEDWQWVQSEVY